MSVIQQNLEKVTVVAGVATAGSVRIIALQDVDFGVKQPGAFCFGT